MLQITVLLSLLAFVWINIATKKGIKDWDENDVEKWLKALDISEDGVEYVLKARISDGEDLLWLSHPGEEKTKMELSSGFKKLSDKGKFEQGLKDLVEAAAVQKPELYDDDDDDNDIKNVISALKQRCNEYNTRDEEVCKCINKKSINIESGKETDDTESDETEDEDEDDIARDTDESYELKRDQDRDRQRQRDESDTESDTLKQHYRDRQNKHGKDESINERGPPRMVEMEEKKPSDMDDMSIKNNKLDVTYTVNEIIEEDELRTEISFTVLNDDIDGIMFLSWCAVDNSDDFCSQQSFFFRGGKKNKILATILTGIAYDFEIYDEKNQYHWTLSDFTDSKPNQAFYFSGIMMHCVLNKHTLRDEKLRSANGANFDLLIEVQLSHKFGIGINQQRIDCDSNDNNDDPTEIQLICVLNIVPNSVDENDKLMAEKIRSVLLDKYRANNVDISQKMDANSFQSGSLSDGWSLSSNYALFLLCAVFLCGGVIAGVYKKFPFKYQNVYARLVDHKDNKSDEMNEHNFESLSIQTEKDLNVNTSSNVTKTNSAQEFLEKVFHAQGTPSFLTSKYIQNLKDDYITSVDQLREFDDEDWKRYGFKNNHIIVIKNKLEFQDDEEEDEDDGSTFDEDDDDMNNPKNVKQSENNDSTTDFDDF